MPTTTTPPTETSRRRPRRRSLVNGRARSLLALLLALSLGAAACGSSDDDSGDDTSTSSTVATDDTEADDTEAEGDSDEADNDDSDAMATPASGDRVRLGSSVLSKTLSADNQANSGRFTGNMVMSGDMGSGAPATITIAFEGAYDVAAEAVSLSMDMSGLMGAMAESDPTMAGMGDLFSEPIRLVTIGEDSWMQWGFFSMMGVGADQWVKLDPEDAGSLTEDMGAGGMGDPTEVLRQLEDADAQIEELGTETIRGVQTTHIRAVIDVQSLAETMSAEDRANFEDTFSVNDLNELPIEFWIGDDGLIYRWSMELDTGAMTDVDGLNSVSMVYEMFDYGQDVGIVAPDPANVIDGSTLGF